MRRAALALIPLALALAGCGIEAGRGSQLDRCGALMRQAFPSGDIAVTAKRLVRPQPTQSYAVTVVDVEGRRRDLAPGSLPLRDLAVQCRFEDGILTSFRWTRGPLR